MAQDFTFGQVQELHPDGGGADVDGQGEVALGGVAGLHVEHVGGMVAAPGEIEAGGDLKICSRITRQLAQQEEVQVRLSMACWCARPCSNRARSLILSPRLAASIGRISF